MGLYGGTIPKESAASREKYLPPTLFNVMGRDKKFIAHQNE
jgi:hypothetical protein